MNYITEKDLGKTSRRNKVIEMKESFFRVPKSLMRSEKYKDLSPAHKWIYVELLDRMGLSISNGWKNKDGQYYVKCSKNSIPESLGLNPQTFQRAKAALEKADLIRIEEINARKHFIYVALPEVDGSESLEEDYPEEVE